MATPVSEERAVPQFAVYLRAFDTTDRMMTQATGSVDTSTSWGASAISTHIDLETVLSAALGGDLPLIAAGRKGDIEGGAGRISFDEDDWQPGIAALCQAAALILLVPSGHEGTLWEMDLLRRHGYLSKTAFIMPETGRAGRIVGVKPSTLGCTFVAYYNYLDYYRDHPADWSRAVQKSSIHRYELPTYHEEGAIFATDASGKCESLHSLDLVNTLLQTRKVRGILMDLGRIPHQAHCG